MKCIGLLSIILVSVVIILSAGYVRITEGSAGVFLTLGSIVGIFATLMAVREFREMGRRCTR
jgi:hypothetical protein